MRLPMRRASLEGKESGTAFGPARPVMLTESVAMDMMSGVGRSEVLVTLVGGLAGWHPYCGAVLDCLYG